MDASLTACQEEIAVLLADQQRAQVERIGVDGKTGQHREAGCESLPALAAVCAAMKAIAADARIEGGWVVRGKKKRANLQIARPASVAPVYAGYGSRGTGSKGRQGDP